MLLIPNSTVNHMLIVNHIHVWYKLVNIYRKQCQCSYELCYNLQVNNISVCYKLLYKSTISVHCCAHWPIKSLLQLFVSIQPCEQSHWLSKIPITKIIGVIDIALYTETKHTYLMWASKCQLSARLPEGKWMAKRQLYSEPFTLREAASSIFKQQW